MRRLLKDREVEDHLFGDKERFVTAAYKRKLEEDKKWLEEEKLRDQVEAEQDVRKRGHMGDFYRSALNTAMRSNDKSTHSLMAMLRSQLKTKGKPSSPGQRLCACPNVQSSNLACSKVSSWFQRNLPTKR